MGVRKNYRALTADERRRLVDALKHVKATGTVDAFAAVHSRHFQMGIHQTSHFLPWHREFLRRFEAELQLFDPAVALPYWDSSVDRSKSDPLWDGDFFGQFDSAWNLLVQPFIASYRLWVPQRGLVTQQVPPTA